MSCPFSRKTETSPKVILVTGAGGYVALNVIHLLAKEPHRIRAALRNVNDKKKVESVQRAAHGSKYPVEFVYGDLLNANSWIEACKGVDIVMHVASPFPAESPKDIENELIRPAVDGTLNVLKAAFNAGVSRVVLTSSTAAIYDFTATNSTFSERDWPDPERTIPYCKSKLLAERAAWDFVEEKKRQNLKVFDLAVINPSFVHGPTFGDVSSLGTSEMAIASFFNGKEDPQNEMYIGHCDVRDVALAHVRAAFLPEAVGHRHLITSESKWFSTKRGFEILKREFEPKGYKLRTKFNHVDDPNNYTDNTRMIKVLGINPIPYEKTIIDMAQSMIDAGIIKK